VDKAPTVTVGKPVEAKQEEEEKRPAEEAKGISPTKKGGATVVIVGGTSATKAAAAPRNLFKSKVNSTLNPTAMRYWLS
jgi:hypothetical protein